MCQISAVVLSGHSLETFNCYVLPEWTISHQASQVHGLKITFSEGKRSLAKNGEVVNSVTIYKAAEEFLVFTNREIDAGDNCPVPLIAHSGKKYDMEILLRFIKKVNAYEQWSNLLLYFVDSCLVCKEKLETLKDGIHLFLSEKTRKPSLKMTESLFGKTFQAHDSLEDVVALNRIMCSNELDVKDSDVVKHSISFSTAVKYVGLLEEKAVHEQEYSSNSRILSSYVIKKLVQCGIVPNVLASINGRFGYRGVICYLYTNKESK